MWRFRCTLETSLRFWLSSVAVFSCPPNWVRSGWLRRRAWTFAFSATSNRLLPQLKTHNKGFNAILQMIESACVTLMITQKSFQIGFWNFSDLELWLCALPFLDAFWGRPELKLLQHCPPRTRKCLEKKSCLKITATQSGLFDTLSCLCIDEILDERIGRLCVQWEGVFERL